MEQKAFLKTGIGSLPYKDPSYAVKKVITSGLDIPFWPQLPKRDFKEGMITQFIEGMPGLSIRDNSIVFEDNNIEKELEKFYDRFLNKDIDYFKISSDYAAGFLEFLNALQRQEVKGNYVKGQVTGLFTFAAAINEKSGKALLHNSIMMDAFVAGLSMKALYQIRKLRQFTKEVVIFFDEPYLGCFGSAYTPILKEDVIKRYGQILNNIKEDVAMVGVHCCGNTDWGLLLGLDIDTISFDAFGFAEKFLLYAEEIKQFLERGGFIAWGLIPTSVRNTDNVNELSKLLKSHFNILAKKGIDLELLSSRSIITPSCGLGTLSDNDADIVLNILSELKF